MLPGTTGRAAEVKGDAMEVLDIENLWTGMKSLQSTIRWMPAGKLSEREQVSWLGGVKVLMVDPDDVERKTRAETYWKAGTEAGKGKTRGGGRVVGVD